MYEFNVETVKNRLITKLSGNIGKLEGEKILRELVNAVAGLQPGFDVITDISGYESANRKNEDLLVRTIEFLKLKGVRHVIRVVGGSKIALVKFAQVTKNVGNYPVRYVPTMEDAFRLLEEE